MKIVVFHGFGSDGKNSSLTKVVSSIPNVNVVPLTYPTKNPVETSVTIYNQLNSAISLDEEVIFVGSSLGGFWAEHFSRRYKNAKLVLINPSTKPWDNLKVRIGENFNYYSNEKFTVTDADVADYRKFATAVPSSTPVYLVVGTADEVVNFRVACDKYTSRAKIVTVPGGDHRLTGFDDIVKKVIDDALNTVADAF